MPQCFKCKNDAGCIASRDGPGKMYCEDCFTAFCTRTVRDAFFKQCRLPCEEPVAVAVSGGAQSMMLLHQLGVLRRQGQLRQGTGTVHFVLLPFHLCEDELLVVDTPSYMTSTIECTTLWRVNADRRTHFAVLREQVQRSPAQWMYASTPLFTENEVQVVHYSDFMSVAQITILRHYLHHPHLTLSDREELYADVRRLVLCAAARRCVRQWRADHRTEVDGTPTASSSATWVHLLLGDGAITAGVAAMHGLVTGGAGEAVVHLSAGRGYVHNVVVLRPLRTLLPMEVILYNRLHHVSGLYTPALCTGTALRSVRRTLEAFLHTILRQQRTMLFNVLNMVGKLQVKPTTVAKLLRGEASDAVPGPIVDAGAATLMAKAVPSLLSAQGHMKRKRGTAVVLGWSSHVARDALRVTAAPHFAYTSAVEQVVCCLLCGCPRELSAEDKMQAPVDEGAMHADVVAAVAGVGVHTIRLAPHTAALSEVESATYCFLCHACYALLLGIAQTSRVSRDHDETLCVSALLFAFLTVAQPGSGGNGMNVC